MIQDPRDLEIPITVREIISIIAGMTPDERVKAISTVDHFYCIHCGEPQNISRYGIHCQCRNDE